MWFVDSCDPSACKSKIYVSMLCMVESMYVCMYVCRCGVVSMGGDDDDGGAR